jgi:2-amino-4-hydroxy-6-hydroxymethyldihydropteridine diphosphokinase
MEPFPLVYLGLGSNLGDREANLTTGVVKIEPLAVRGSVRCSSIYETTPWGKLDQPDFLNLVVEMETFLQPPELLERIKAIEFESGRDSLGERWGPRSLDIDILLYGETIIATETLTIPHKEIAGRRFVLVPLWELAPHKVIPVIGKTVTEALNSCKDTGEVSLYRESLKIWH